MRELQHLTQPVTVHQLARLYGVQTSYTDIMGQRHVAGDEALMAVLRILGADIVDPRQAPRAWNARVRQMWRELCSPVAVAWQGMPAGVALRLGRNESRVEAELTLERGEVRRWAMRTSELTCAQQVSVDGKPLELRGLPLPTDLPTGYHWLRLKAGRRSQRVLVVCAPRRAYGGDAEQRRIWGVFAPIYAVRSASDWGCGDYSSLAQLGQWLAERGGGIVATLPFCATFWDALHAPSPYSPASRLFWNELYVDPRQAPNLQQCPEAQRLLQQVSQQSEELRQRDTVDYRAVWALKRRVLEPLSRQAQASDAHRAALERQLRQQPALGDYARFRAATEWSQMPWHMWSQPQREGELSPGDWSPEEEQLHIYIQWLADQQIDELAHQAQQRGPGLYVDLPLGVHDCGYDVWRHQQLFPMTADVGAPPDALFTGGQKWGFPPLHPLRAQQSHYRHVIDYLSRITRKAGILRVDHVMGLHRLFWIPKGMEVRDGVYVSYPAEQKYAILSLESHRNRCLLVGENLGTVPDHVNQSMERHGIRQMYVMQYELGGDEPRAVPRAAVASLNTHDMPPFAGFWRGCDIDERNALGLTSDETRAQEQREREQLKQRLVAALRRQELLTEDASVQDEQLALSACLAFLARSQAEMALVNMEDLWMETEPQNVPGFTDDVLPIWRRRLRLTLEQLAADRPADQILERVDRARGPDDA